MRKLNLFKTGFATAIMVAVLFTGCKKTEAPNVDFIAEVNGYTVTFTTESTGGDIDTWSWNYGDGLALNPVMGNHTYTYAESGSYTVSLTVVGEGGEVTKSLVVEILPGLMELLTGGPSATSGKTWEMSTSATLGTDGASEITPSNYNTWISQMGNLPFPNNVLTIVDMADEYDNLYTFMHDGTMTIDPGNGKVIAGGLYASVTVPADIVKQTAYGLFQINYTAPTGMGFSIANETISMEIATEVDGGDDLLSSMTDPDVDVITFTGGGFLGMLDFPTKAIIREMDQSRLVVTVFLHGTQNTPLRPSIAITVSFDAVPD